MPDAVSVVRDGGLGVRLTNCSPDSPVSKSFAAATFGWGWGAFLVALDCLPLSFGGLCLAVSDKLTASAGNSVLLLPLIFRLVCISWNRSFTDLIFRAISSLDSGAAAEE